MKKITAVILAVLMLLPMAVTAFAIPLSEGSTALDKQMLDGKIDSTGVDYVYYSPVKGDGDNTKYPLMIWLHGMRSGQTKRAQLQWYEFSNWASDEYQSRFENAGGCFLFAPRAQNSTNNWEGADCVLLKKTIDAFIAQLGDSVDRDRIYIGGYSTGGLMVWEMISQYPDFFAAGLPLASVMQPSVSQINQLSNVSVWMMASDNDPYPLGQSEDALASFNYLAGTTKRKDGIRLTTFSDVVFADYTRKQVWSNGKLVIASDAQHYLWEAVTYDMHMADGVTPYVNTTTKDAAGNKIVFDESPEGVISWLSRQSRNHDGSSGEDVNFFTRLILAIKRFFEMIATLFKGIGK